MFLMWKLYIFIQELKKYELNSIRTLSLAAFCAGKVCSELSKFADFLNHLSSVSVSHTQCDL